ncbi:MAG TPA: ABC transporter ATP-binding protein [bacterium]|nr:ABC transporter ATP-binding protein [bacterium]
MAPLLEVRELRTHFVLPGGVLRAVDGVDLTVSAGQTLGIVGESGSGKTVLARSLLRLIPEPPGMRAGGAVLFRGMDLQRLSERALRKIRGAEIGMVFQDPMTSLNPVLTIGQQIAEVLEVHLALGRVARRKRTLDLLERVGIPAGHQRVHDYPHQLSGGMRQRVTIAMALACQPKLLIADEPTTALDVTIQMQILQLLKSYQRDTGMAMIYVSHDLGAVASVADTVSVMYAGRIVETLPAARLFAGARMPYTEALLRARPDPDARPHTRLAALEGQPPSPLDKAPGCPFAPRCAYADPRCRQWAPPLLAERDHSVACWKPLAVHAPARKESWA